MKGGGGGHLDIHLTFFSHGQTVIYVCLITFAGKQQDNANIYMQSKTWPKP